MQPAETKKEPNTMLCQDPKAMWRYVLVRDRYDMKHPEAEKRGKAKPDATIHILYHLTLREEEALFNGLDRASDGTVMRRDLGTSYGNTLRAAYGGWVDNTFKDTKGAVIECERHANGRATEKSIFRMDIGARHELAQAIENEIEFDPDEAGK